MYLLTTVVLKLNHIVHGSIKKHKHKYNFKIETRRIGPNKMKKACDATHFPCIFCKFFLHCSKLCCLCSLFQSVLLHSTIYCIWIYNIPSPSLSSSLLINRNKLLYLLAQLEEIQSTLLFPREKNGPLLTKSIKQQPLKTKVAKSPSPSHQFSTE